MSGDTFAYFPFFLSIESRPAALLRVLAAYSGLREHSQKQRAHLSFRHFEARNPGGTSRTWAGVGTETTEKKSTFGLRAMTLC